MRIKDVENLTGLTRKSIRFYESKGLLNVKRSDNSFRDYDSQVVQRLKAIAILRKVGAAISDIQLWTDQVITLDEMLRKRLSELKDHTELTASQTVLCRELLAAGNLDNISASHSPQLLDEEEHVTEWSPDAQLSLGLDIGTSTISSVILNLSTGTIVAAYTIQNDTYISSNEPWEKCQDATKIMDRLEKLTNSLLSRYPAIRFIGLTGQMHGILYLDKQNQPCSPLYTWQDGRANCGALSTCQLLQQKTGLSIPAGYGLATHCHLLRTGTLPVEAVRLCTIMDYAAWKLTGFQTCRMHSTNAAGLGFFDQKTNCFSTDILKEAGIAPGFLPSITNRQEILGYYRGISVSVAIGDNQASFLGTVRDGSSMVLANFGTGSQISLLADAATAAACTSSGDIEIRPLLENTYLLSGSALCGGRAYALLEQFFRSFVAASDPSVPAQYEILNRMAIQGLQQDHLPVIRTTFCGTRRDASIRGEITGLGEENFTPEAFAAGTLLGMCQELLDMYQRMPKGSIRTLVASGNGVRRNPALRQALQQTFHMDVCIPVHREEAAFGAAMFAGSAGGFSTLEQLSQMCIHYQP